MSIFSGGSEIGGMYLGSKEISEMYLGSNLIYQNVGKYLPIRYIRSSDYIYVASGFQVINSKGVNIVEDMDIRRRLSRGDWLDFSPNGFRCNELDLGEVYTDIMEITGISTTSSYTIVNTVNSNAGGTRIYTKSSRMLIPLREL